MAGKRDDYYSVLSAAVADLLEHGFDSEARVAFWADKLREAAKRLLRPPAEMERALRDTLAAIYRRMIERGQIAQYHQGIKRFTIDMVRPQLRAELDRRIMASANLIKLNREDMINATVRRFSGWATSIPKGGTERPARQKAKEEIRKPLAEERFRENRVLTDQGHKLRASLSEILAADGGAIALIWRSHWRQANYDYRETHKERDGKVYTIRNNWAQAAGLMKAGDAGYYDQITAVAEEVSCRCYATWLYSLSALPDDILTAKGRSELARAKAAA